MGTLLSGLSGFFPWLTDYTIDISILICVVFIIKLIVSKRLPAWWHYGLWLVLLVRMIVPWEFENHLGIENVMPFSISQGLFGSMLPDKGALISGISTGTPSNIQGWNVPVDKALLFIWLGGAIFFGTYILVKNIRFWLIIKKRPLLIDKKLLDLLEECKSRMKINTVLGILITDKVNSPALFGYFRPRLLLPEGVLEKLSEAELAYVFMHELGHLKRHDIGVSWIITLLHVIHWFNPLVWFAFYHMRIDQESACDASVLSRIRHNQSADYAGTIIGFLEKFCQNRQLPALAGIMENKSQIKRRLSMIINYRKYSKRMTAAAVVALIMTGFIFFTLTGFAKEEQSPSEWDPVTREVMEEAMQSGDLDSREKIFTDYLATAPEFIPEDLYIMLGDVFFWQGRLDEALNIYEQGHEAYPDSEEINVKILECHAKQALEYNRFIEAGNIYEEIYAINPDNNRSNLVSAARSYFMAGYIEEAERVYRIMVDLLDDQDVLWRESLIETCIMLGLEDEAEVYREELVYMDVYSELVSSGDIYGLSEVDEKPSVLEAFPPVYPDLAKRKNITGRVVLRFVVTKEGKAQYSVTVESKPYGVFDESALEALRQYRFKPGIKDGEAVDVMVNMPIRYELQ